MEIALNSGTLAALAPPMLSILRIVTALLFFEHGTQKLLGFPAAESYPATLSLPWIAGVFELIGGALLIIGLLTRPVAFLLSGTMAVAYWIAHSPGSLYPIQNAGEAAILYCFVFLYLVFAGPGPLSVDALIRGTSNLRR